MVSNVQDRRCQTSDRLRRSQPAAARPPIVWEVRGELDLVGGTSLRDATTELPDRGRLLYVDLGGVSFMDCSGLDALIDLCRRCCERGVDVVVTRARDNVLRLIAVTGADRELNLSPDWRFVQG